MCQNIIFMEKIDKTLIIHVACEVIVIGGIAIYFYKKTNDLKSEIEELKKSIELLKNSQNFSHNEKFGNAGYLSKIQFDEYSSQINEHFNRIYGVLNQIVPKMQNIEKIHIQTQTPSESKIEEPPKSCFLQSVINSVIPQESVENNLQVKNEENSEDLDKQIETELKEIEEIEESGNNKEQPISDDKIQLIDESKEPQKLEFIPIKEKKRKKNQNAKPV
jgi:hypothetical protein